MGSGIIQTFLWRKKWLLLDHRGLKPTGKGLGGPLTECPASALTDLKCFQKLLFPFLPPKSFSPIQTVPGPLSSPPPRRLLQADRLLLRQSQTLRLLRPLLLRQLPPGRGDGDSLAPHPQLGPGETRGESGQGDAPASALRFLEVPLDIPTVVGGGGVMGL